ncbi:MAG: cation diffusion facilitator family transporter [Methylococcaceae bacterium]
MAEAINAALADKLKKKASLVGAAINIIQTLIKIGFGILGQSAALIADGIHSLSDLLSDLLVIIAVRMGSREADKDHPYGHRRFETIATIILGMSLITIGAGITWTVLHRMTHPEQLPTPQPLTLGVAVISILINEWLYHYTKKIAKLSRSKLLLANAWHQRSDAISSLVVLIGVGAVLLGYPFADAIAAVIVALMVAKIGLNLVIESIKELVDTSLPPKLIKEIRKVILSIEGVEGIHLLRSRYSGEDAFVDAHIIVDPRITVSEGHSIGDAVRDEVIKQFDDIMDVLVHIDPENDEGSNKRDKPLSRADIQKILDKYLIAHNIAVEDFKIHYLDGLVEIEVIIPYTTHYSAEQLEQLKNHCQFIVDKVKKVNNVIIFFKL